MKREEVEICPYCMNENIVNWDVEKDGYEITCQYCGEKILLCDACLHSDDNKGGQCDWNDEKGCFRIHKQNNKFEKNRREKDVTSIKCVRCKNKIKEKYFEGAKGKVCKKCLQKMYVYEVLKEANLIKIIEKEE